MNNEYLSFIQAILYATVAKHIRSFHPAGRHSFTLCFLENKESELTMLRIQLVENGVTLSVKQLSKT